MKFKGKTIHKHPKAKTWYTRLRHDNKQYYISGKTQLECMQKLKQALSDLKLKTTPHIYIQSENKITFIEWYKEWLTRFKKNIKTETIRDYNKNLNKLTSEFKNMEITKITSFNINDLLEKETKPRAKQKLYEFLNAIFKKAKDYKVIQENIFDVIEKPHHIKKEGIALTQNQQTEFIKICNNTPYGNYYIKD